MYTRLVCIILAVVYFWLYPSILLVPAEYRTGFWSSDYNIARQGLVIDREVWEIDSLLKSHRIYRVLVLTGGNAEYFWVASSMVYDRLVTGEIARFETRGRVVVLAGTVKSEAPILSRLY